ncbi:ribonuclease III, partial [Candidatus Gracilibacteria bacterium]
AKKLGFADYLLLGNGEEKSGGRNNNYLLANVVEAFIGALYLDLGLEEAKKFINKFIYTTVDEILTTNAIKEYKTLVQEFAQAKFDITPTYEIIDEYGLDHEKTFIVGIYFGTELKGQGNGSSKKKAQESAAKDAYLKLNSDENI